MDTSVLDDGDIAEYLELHSENIIPSGSEDEECSLSGDELFEVDVAQQNISEGIHDWSEHLYYSSENRVSSFYTEEEAGISSFLRFF
ncbi:hypothetical protein J6590_095072 [Homalodisca vitripennis]|nr:hypothetical protein J6590_095072 [Homalodisca vitripennis]